MSISAGKRQNCYRRDGYRCVKCGCRENLTIDHVIPVSLGGKCWLKNLQTLCRCCNLEKGNRVIQYTTHQSTTNLVREYWMSEGNPNCRYQYIQLELDEAEEAPIYLTPAELQEKQTALNSAMRSMLDNIKPNAEVQGLSKAVPLERPIGQRKL